MTFWLGFLFGAYYAGNRVSRVLFLLWILFLTFCLYEMSKPLGSTWAAGNRCNANSVTVCVHCHRWHRSVLPGWVL